MENLEEIKRIIDVKTENRLANNTMDTLEKINHVNDLIQYSTTKMDMYYGQLHTWNELQGNEPTLQRVRAKKRIEYLKMAQNRLINYMRKQAVNLIVEIG